MKLFRVVDKVDFDLGNALSGNGASAFGGRWNPIGTRTIYSGTEIETVVAEKAHYAMLNRLKLVPPNTLITGKINSDLKKLLKPRQFVLIEFEMVDNNLCSIYDDLSLINYLSRYQLPQYTVNDSRKSPHDLLPNQWTRILGKTEMELGKIGLITKSARSDCGYCTPLYPDNFKPKALGSIKTSIIEMTFANCELEAWSKNQPFDLSGICLTSDSFAKKYMPVLNFQL